MIPNDCSNTGRLRAYLDSAIPAIEQEEVTLHLATCQSCRTHLGEMREVAKQVSSLIDRHADAPTARIAFARLQATRRIEDATMKAPRPLRALQPRHTPRTPSLTQPSKGVQGRMRLPAVGMGLALAIMLALGVSALLASGTISPLGADASQFLPAGKVRHIVVETTYTNSSNSSLFSSREHVWLANGKDHLLMYSNVPGLDYRPERWQLIDDEAVWTYRSPRPDIPPSQKPERGAVILKTAYDERHFTEYVPDKATMSELLARPNTHKAGADKIEGRDAIIIESSGNSYGNVSGKGKNPPGYFIEFEQWPGKSIGFLYSNPDPESLEGMVLDPTTGQMMTYTLPLLPYPAPATTAEPYKVEPYRVDDPLGQFGDYRIWFDKETHRVLKQERTFRFNGGYVGNEFVEPSMSVETRNVVKDELLDISAVPPDLFKLKVPDGTTVSDAGYVFLNYYAPMRPADATPSPSPK